MGTKRRARPVSVRTMKWVALFVTAAVLVAGCFESADQPRTLPSPTGDQRSETLPDDRVRYWPRSAPVDEGVNYTMVAYTHCGLDYLLDFDTSSWVVQSGPEPTPLDDPFDAGVIRLISEGEAVFVSAAGDEFALARTEGPREVGYCE
jgi:hypothetical protein